jgi:hypothetical protein
VPEVIIDEGTFKYVSLNANQGNNVKHIRYARWSIGGTRPSKWSKWRLGTVHDDILQREPQFRWRVQCFLQVLMRVTAASGEQKYLVRGTAGAAP